MGSKKYLPDEQSKQDTVGVVNGLAWTSVGGVLMPLEVIVMNGKGQIEITGSLGDVMKESAKLQLVMCVPSHLLIAFQKSFMRRRICISMRRKVQYPKMGLLLV